MVRKRDEGSRTDAETATWGRPSGRLAAGRLARPKLLMGSRMAPVAWPRGRMERWMEGVRVETPCGGCGVKPHASVLAAPVTSALSVVDAFFHCEALLVPGFVGVVTLLGPPSPPSRASPFALTPPPFPRSPFPSLPLSLAPSCRFFLAAIMMYGATLRTVTEARRAHSLKELSPLPFPVLLANSAGWVGYACVTRDPFVLVPNLVGVLLGVFYTLVVASLATQRARDTVTLEALVGTAIILGLSAYGPFSGAETETVRAAWGWGANLILVAYYASPLSTVALVVRTRSSGSLHPGMVTMNLINGALWTSYGFAVADPFIYVINGLGAVISVILLALTIVYPREGTAGTATPAERYERLEDGADPGEGESEADVWRRLPGHDPLV